MRSLPTLAVAALALSSSTLASQATIRGRPDALLHQNDKRAPLQNIVTWDSHSVSINGKRLMLFSGEYHPYRLPVPSLWLDVFQKIKALGLDMVSFYIDWALLEGKPGDFEANGVFDFTGFLEAAHQAGLYLNARPGPYINAEVSGGGFPGWLQRVKGTLRTNASDYLATTDNYMSHVAKIIAKYQITNGGSVILWQPENEYTQFSGSPFSPPYMQYVEDQARNNGIVVPLMSNDASPQGHNVPGSGVGAVDIYGYDSYPLGFNCAAPSTWPAGSLPTSFYSTHEKESPSTPNAIPEFQGGSFDPWGGLGFDKCTQLLGPEFERVFYKNNFAAGITILSLYMIFGGTNWGNLGHPGGYTSYDYGSPIKEDRTVTREKYAELKLEAQFLKVSPGYLIATPQPLSTTAYTSNPAIAVTPVTGTNGSFWVARHADFTSLASTTYSLKLSTSLGNITVPQLGGSLTLNGRDSKVHVTDYPVGSSTLLYSTAEIYTWQQYGSQAVLVVYGGSGELHELAVKGTGSGSVIEGSGVTFKQLNGTTVAQWQTSAQRTVISFPNLKIYLLDRNSAYKYWVPDLSPSSGSSAAIINGPYLVRNASVSGSTLDVTADFNTSAPVEVIGAPASVTAIAVNGQTATATLSASVTYSSPQLQVPSLKSLNWQYIDSLPEVQPEYDDSAWTVADHTTTNNKVQPFLTPVSLYASDYGYHTGALIYRAHLVATGSERQITLVTQGGSAFASSVWINGTFVGSWTATDAATNHNSTYSFPTKLAAGKNYVITVLIDNMGLDENWTVGLDEMKHARGILNYSIISGCNKTATLAGVTWKLTGNLGGESYADHTRGPLNEGGLFIERQGYHQPSPPSSAFTTGSSPYAGLTSAGVGFWTAKMTLDLPTPQYDIPLSFAFTNDTSAAAAAPYRAWLYVNGWQFGRYVSNVGPQTSFPVPEGILNYKGDNWVGLAVWAVTGSGAKVPDLELVAGTPVLTGRSPVQVVDSPAWTKRAGAY